MFLELADVVVGLLCQLSSWLHDESHHTRLLLPRAGRLRSTGLEWNQFTSLGECGVAGLEAHRQHIKVM